jgi:hypothetical protein
VTAFPVQVLLILHDRCTHLAPYRTVLRFTAVASSPHLYCTEMYCTFSAFPTPLCRRCRPCALYSQYCTTLECKMHNALTLYISSSSSSLSSSSSSTSSSPFLVRHPLFFLLFFDLFIFFFFFRSFFASYLFTSLFMLNLHHQPDRKCSLFSAFLYLAFLPRDCLMIGFFV